MTTTTHLAHYRRLQAELAAARQAAVNKEREFDAFRVSICGVKEGDIVTLRDGAVARVAVVKPNGINLKRDGTFGRPWLVINIQKKDGSWSATRRNFYGDWTLGTPEVTA